MEILRRRVPGAAGCRAGNSGGFLMKERGEDGGGPFQSADARLSAKVCGVAFCCRPLRPWAVGRLTVGWPCPIPRRLRQGKRTSDGIGHGFHGGSLNLVLAERVPKLIRVFSTVE